jgi:alanine racemase
MPALYGFGLATLGEAKELRQELGPAGKRVRLIVFSGATPWSDEKGQFCEKYGITPVIATDADWQAFFKGGWAARLPYELKFNTGLNRLGMSLNFGPTVVRTLKNRPAIEHPAGVFSHLVMSETPDSKISLSQLDKFVWLKRELGQALPSTQFHLGNSAAIWNHKLWGLRDLTDVVRPGLALYGIPPWKGAPARGLRPVLTLEAEVVHRHRLKAGESVGYGATFKVSGSGKGSETVQVATIAAGYADGISRMLSSRGFVWLRGRKMRILGRVSMDLCAVECPVETQVGDWAEFLGPDIDPWEQAEAAGTIPYELLTSISSRVQRIDG